MSGEQDVKFHLGALPLSPCLTGAGVLLHHLWLWSRMHCVTLLFLCEVLLFSLGDECDNGGFCFRIYWENRREKTWSCSKKRMLSISPANPIFSDRCFSQLFLTTSSERDVLESWAEIEIYIGCFRASVLLVLWWWWCEFEFGDFGGATCQVWMCLLPTWEISIWAPIWLKWNNLIPLCCWYSTVNKSLTTSSQVCVRVQVFIQLTYLKQISLLVASVIIFPSLS